MNPKLPGTIYVYDVVDGRELHNRRVFAFCAIGIPDGIKCDEKGYVYAGCGKLFFPSDNCSRTVPLRQRIR
jgi:gluconolactonase